MLYSSIEASALAEGRSKGPDLSKAAAFLLDCLGKLPNPLLAVLAQPLLLQPLNEVHTSCMLPAHQQAQGTKGHVKESVEFYIKQKGKVLKKGGQNKKPLQSFCAPLSP